MIYVLGVAMCFTIVSVGVLGFAVAELNSNIHQLRSIAGLTDAVTPVDLKRVQGRAPSTFGLPTLLDSMPAAAILILSMKCGTCTALAQSLSRRFWPRDLFVVLQCATAPEGEQWLASNGLSINDSIVLDTGGICAGLGVQMSPISLAVVNGRLSHAHSVPSSKYLNDLLPEVHVLTNGVAL